MDDKDGYRVPDEEERKDHPQRARPDYSVFVGNDVIEKAVKGILREVLGEYMTQTKIQTLILDLIMARWASLGVRLSRDPSNPGLAEEIMAEMFSFCRDLTKNREMFDTLRELHKEHALIDTLRRLHALKKQGEATDFIDTLSEIHDKHRDREGKLLKYLQIIVGVVAGAVAIISGIWGFGSHLHWS